MKNRCSFNGPQAYAKFSDHKSSQMNGSFSFMALILPFLFIHIVYSWMLGRISLHIARISMLFDDHRMIGDTVRWYSMQFNDIQRYSMVSNNILPHGLIRLASPIEPVSASKLWTMISVLSWNVWSQYIWHRPACVHHYPVFTERCFRQFEVQTLNSNASAPIRFGQ